MDKKQLIQEKRYLIPYHYLDLYSDEHKLLHHVSYLYRIKKALKDGIDGSLIDVGCGDGRLIYEAIGYKKFSKLVGVDYSDKAISFAKIINNNCKFYSIDLTANISKLKIEKFNNLFCLETLEHIEINKVDKFLSNCKNLLEKDGQAIFTVPSSYFICEEKHYQHFSYLTLKETLEKHFNVISIIGLDDQTRLKKILINFFFRLSKTFFPFRHLSIIKTLSESYSKNYNIVSEGDHDSCSGLMAICKNKEKNFS